MDKPLKEKAVILSKSPPELDNSSAQGHTNAQQTRPQGQEVTDGE